MHSMKRGCFDSTQVGTHTAQSLPSTAQVRLTRHRCQVSAGARAAGTAAGSTGKLSGRPLDDAQTQAFVQWARDAKIKWQAMCPAVFSDGVRGMMASGSIRSGDVLISVPRDTAITLPPRQSCPFPDFVSAEYWDSAPWFARLALKLLHQRSLGPAGRLATYLQQLPDSVQTPIWWDEARLQLLQYHHLIQQVKEQREEWQTLHTQLQAALKPGRAVSQDDFYWAMSIVRSRTFSGPYVGSTLQERGWLLGLLAVLVAANSALGLADLQTSLTAAVAALVFNVMYELILSGSLKQYAICPLIDFINHTSDSQAEVSYDFFRDSYSVAAGRHFAQGQQVYITYGSRSNDSLMQYYGFSEVDNPYDVYVMTNLLKSLERVAARPAQDRLDSLNRAGLLTALQLVSVQRSGFPASTLQALRYLLASPTEAARGPEAFASVAGRTSSSSSSSEDLVESTLAEVLVQAINDELQLMGTSLSEDEALASSKRGRGLSEVEQSALRFRIEKKKVLAACLAALGGGVGSGVVAGAV